MKCFYDRTQDAVGLCKSCGKALSAEYAVDLGKGLACKERCEGDVRALIALIDNNVAMGPKHDKVFKESAGAGAIGAVFIVLMGTVIFVSGLALTSPRRVFIMLLGGLFFAWGLFGLFRAYSIRRTFSDSQKPEN